MTTFNDFIRIGKVRYIGGEIRIELIRLDHDGCGINTKQNQKHPISLHGNYKSLSILPTMPEWTDF